MPARNLPARPDLQQYRTQAKELLKQYRAGDVSALNRFREHHPARRNSGSTPRRAFRLSDAQCVLAREHGFDSWPKFVKQLDAGPPVIHLQVPTPGEVNLAVFLAGSRMLTATEAEPVRLWDVAVGNCLREFGDYSNHAWALKASSDHHSVVMGCRDGDVRIVDLAEGSVAKRLAGHRGLVRCVDATDDSRIVISGGMQDRALRVWDVGSGRCMAVLEGHRDGVYCVALDREGRTALSGSRDGTVRVWDLARGQCSRVIDAHPYHVHAVAWAADGRRALSCAQEIRLWDLESGRSIRVFEGHTETIRSLSWSPDHRLVLSAAHDRTVRVWNVETGACVQIFTGHSAGVINAAWVSRDRIVSCDWTGEVRMWNA